MYETAQFIIMILLTGISVWDIFYRSFQTKALVLILSFIVICRLFMGEMHPWEMFGGCMVGVLFVCLSKVTEEAIGYADSFLIVTFGILLGLQKLLIVLLIAFSLAAIVAAGIAIKSRFSGIATLPFLPFLTISYAGVMTLYA